MYPYSLKTLPRLQVLQLPGLDGDLSLRMVPECFNSQHFKSYDCQQGFFNHPRKVILTSFLSLLILMTALSGLWS